MKTQIPEVQLVPIKEALLQGRKIEAIKLYREYTENGLAEAKSAVEQLEAELRAASPEKFSTKPPGKRWFPVVIVVCAIAILIVLWICRH